MVPHVLRSDIFFFDYFYSTILFLLRYCFIFFFYLRELGSADRKCSFHAYVALFNASLAIAFIGQFIFNVSEKRSISKRDGYLLSYSVSGTFLSTRHVLFVKKYVYFFKLKCKTKHSITYEVT